MRRLPSKKALLLSGGLGVATIAVIVCVVLLVHALVAFSPATTGKFELANKLFNAVSEVPCFKDGNLYYVKDGTMTLAAQDVYDKTDANGMWNADYAIDANSGRMVYVTDGKLYLFDGEKNTLIGSAVAAWKTSGGIASVAFASYWKDSKSIGVLYLYHNGTVTPIDAGVDVSSFRFSQDGQYLFALKPNTYPQVRNTLVRYDLEGNAKIIDKNCSAIMWISEDGGTLITGESVDDSLYSYRMFYNKLTKSRTFNKVYLSAISDDKSVAYLLCDYDSDAASGTLLAVDLHKVRTRTIAEDVSYFNEKAVTDIAKGIVYSVKTDATKDLYSVYYSDLAGNKITLVRNTFESAMDTVALNTASSTGYLLVPGSSHEKNSIWRISWKNNNLQTERMMTGYVDSLVYYGCTDAVTFVKNPSQNGGSQLYLLGRTGDPQKLVEDCASVYDSTSDTYTSRSILSNDGKTLLYFTDLLAGDSTLEMTGTMKLYRVDTGETVTVAQNVSAAYLSCPVTDENITQLYYCVADATEKGKFDLYWYQNNQSNLVIHQAEGIVTLTN